MSLVNNSLKNLHNRSKQEKITEPQGDLPSPSKNKTKRYIYLIIAIIIVALAFFFVPRKHSNQPQPSLEIQSIDKTDMSINHRGNQYNSIMDQQSRQTATSSADITGSPSSTNIDKTIPSQSHHHSSNPTRHPDTATNPDSNNATISDKPIPAEPPAKTEPPPAPQPSVIQIKEPPLTKEQWLAKQYNQAMEKLHQQHPQQAIHQLIAILQQDPEYKNARLSLAALLIQQKQTYRAERLLQTGLQQQPNDPDYAKLYAHLLVQRGATAQALQLLNQAKPSHIENHVDYFALMASLSMQQQDYRNAEALYRLLVSQEPLNSTWWAGLGIAADKLGLSMEAHDAFTRANRIGNLPLPLQRYIDNTLRQ